MIEELRLKTEYFRNLEGAVGERVSLEIIPINEAVESGLLSKEYVSLETYSSQKGYVVKYRNPDRPEDNSTFLARTPDEAFRKYLEHLLVDLFVPETELRASLVGIVGAIKHHLKDIEGILSISPLVLKCPDKH